MNFKQQNVMNQMKYNEEILSQIFFYSKELARQALKCCTIIKNSHGNQLWCKHYKDETLEKPKTRKLIQKKNGCSRRAGIAMLKGSTYAQHKGKYNKFFYIMNEEMLMFPVDQFQKEHTYFYISLRGQHDSEAEFPCQDDKILQYNFLENLSDTKEGSYSEFQKRIRQISTIDQNQYENYKGKSHPNQINISLIQEKKIIENFVATHAQFNW
ncbi:Hypothetical_protein [Hexamita inflata]|uniref:Hypothetical_protein n=1 Tax=Hexamita inflata TaxID=28002 RepID=A0AA86RVN7_9EUKA|nr:Hypothetical protein HINF_LOCUS66562 [Hexamita inflata]